MTETTPRRTVRIPTLLFGIVLLAVAGLGFALVLNVQFDIQLAAIGLIALCGVALLIGAVASARKNRNQ